MGDRLTLRIERSEDEGRNLSGIFVNARAPGGDQVSATAEKGQFLRTDDPDVIIFRLTKGTLIHQSPKFAVPRVLTFDAHDLPIDLPKFEQFRKRGENKLELTLPQLAEIGRDKATSEKERDVSRSAFHFRVVEIATMFLLPLLALALGVPPKRSTSALGVFVSIVMIVTFHKVNEYAQGVGARGAIDPLIALWAPFLIFAGLVLWMFYTIAFVPGGQPIGALEKFFAKAWQAIRRYLPGRRRKATRA
jgi:lipopolysaccharide export system permease protein